MFYEEKIRAIEEINLIHDLSNIDKKFMFKYSKHDNDYLEAITSFCLKDHSCNTEEDKQNRALFLTDTMLRNSFSNIIFPELYEKAHKITFAFIINIEVYFDTRVITKEQGKLISDLADIRGTMMKNRYFEEGKSSLQTLAEETSHTLQPLYQMEYVTKMLPGLYLRSVDMGMSLEDIEPQIEIIMNNILDNISKHYTLTKFQKKEAITQIIKYLSTTLNIYNKEIKEKYGKGYLTAVDVYNVVGEGLVVYEYMMKIIDSKKEETSERTNTKQRGKVTSIIGKFLKGKK